MLDCDLSSCRFLRVTREAIQFLSELLPEAKRDDLLESILSVADSYHGKGWGYQHLERFYGPPEDEITGTEVAPYCLPVLIHYGADEVCRRLVLAETDVNVENPVYGTPLYAAVHKRNEPLTQFLIRHGADVNRTGGQLQTVLHLACSQAADNIVVQLLEAGAEVNHICDSFGSPLLTAVTNNHISSVKVLLQHQADPNMCKDSRGTREKNRPLHLAVKNGNTSLVKTLLEVPTVEVEMKDGFNAIPLYYALNDNWRDISDLLLSHPATDRANAARLAVTLGNPEIISKLFHLGVPDLTDPKACAGVVREAVSSGSDLTATFILQNCAFDPNYGPGDYFLPLALAARAGLENTVRILLDNGADVNTTKSDLPPPLFLAAREGHHRVIQILLQQGADPMKGSWGSFPIHEAASHGHVEVVQSLLDQGHVDVNLRNQGGLTPLCIAALFNNEGVVRMLLTRAGLLINARTNYGLNALSYASGGPDAGIVTLLLEHGAEIDISGGCRTTGLIYATMRGHIDTVKVLVRSGTNVNAVDEHGLMPLHYAVEGHRVEILQALLERGDLQLHPPDHNGMTPVDIALREEYNDLAAMILDEGRRRRCVTVPFSRL